MKKFIALFLVLIMTVFASAACGSSGDGSGAAPASIDDVRTIGDIIALDSADTQYAVYEDVVVYAFKLGDNYYRAKAAISAEDSRAYFDIDYSDPDHEKKQNAIVEPLKIDEIEDLNDQILSQEELDALAGRTGRELQDEGWTFSGHNLETMEFWMNYGPFMYTVVFDGEVAESDYDSFEDESGTGDLKVKSAEFSTMGDATNIK